MQERLQKDNIMLPVIVITAHAETSLTVRAMRNGAITLLEKPCREHELWEAIGHALAQDANNREKEQRRQELLAKLDRLTENERQVLNMIVGGMLNKQIASDLDVSVRTIESRRRNIFEKTETSSVAELVQLVFRSRDDAQ